MAIAATERVQRGLAGLVARPGFWAVFVAFMVAWPIARAVRSPVPAQPPVLGALAPFSLTDQHGRAFGARDLAGKVWVANFIFTRCPTVCPAFTAKMAQVQHRSRNLGTSFHLVSFSVDPEVDTPPVLAAYARKHRASQTRWSFLTGPLDELKRTVVDGLKVSMGRSGPADDLASIFHGTHFVLVDDRMKIRGYYDSSDDDAVDRLLRDAGLLLARR